MCRPPYLRLLESRLAPAVFNIDPGDTAQLVAAIITCNGNNQPDVINLAAGSTYAFAAGNDTLDGGSALPRILLDSKNPANTVTINGNGATITRDAGAPPMRLIAVDGALDGPGKLIANNLTLTGGSLNGIAAPLGGGAIYLVGGSLELTNVAITGNTANFGGGIASITSSPARTIVLNDCAITANTATDSNGGGLSNQGTAQLTMNASTVSDNVTGGSGGGLWNQHPDAATIVSISNSTFSGNRITNTTASGGGILVQGGLVLTESTVFNNTSGSFGGGIFVQGQIIARRSAVTSNVVQNTLSSGGGLFVQDFAGGKVPQIIENCTFHGNLAADGGGMSLSNTIDARITHSTITGNKVTGVFAAGAGIDRSLTVNLTMGHTIVAENTKAALSHRDVEGNIISLGYNFIANGTGTTFTGVATSNQVGTSGAPLIPQLQPLGDFGGPTESRPPLPGSPVLNAGDPAFVSPPTTDQRGFNRAFGTIDIGAVEVSPPAKVSGVVVNNGDAQRARVTTVAVVFDQVVNLPVTPETAFQLTRQSDGKAVALTATVDNSGPTTIVNLTFNGALSENSSLQDGRYTLTALSGSIDNANGDLDGNNDGVAGGDYVVVGDPAVNPRLYRLFGDANADGKVDSNDFIAFRAAFNASSPNPAYNPAFDFDNDGKIDSQDFINFRQRFNMNA